MTMEVDDAGTSMDTSDSGPVTEAGVQWKFSQVKGSVDGDETHTEGWKFYFDFRYIIAS